MNVLRNKAALVGAGVCGIILLIEVVVLIMARVEFSQQKDQLAQSYRRLSGLHNRNPFPSLQNIEIMEGNLDSLEFQTGELLAALKRDPFPADAEEATDFSARAQDVIERFRARAADAGVTLPDSLEVGFAQYASKGVVPDSKFVPRLSRQLYSVERVAEVLVEGGVQSIEGLTRDYFEREYESTQPAADRRRSARRAPGPVSRKRPNLLIASEIHPDNLYYIERVGVTFTAKQDVLWRVLHLFETAPHVMAVSEFSHSTQSDIIQYSPEEIKRGGNSDDATLRYLSEGILVGKKALSRSERIISGDDDIQVRLMIDVYNFNPGGGRP